MAADQRSWGLEVPRRTASRRGDAGHGTACGPGGKRGRALLLSLLGIAAGCFVSDRDVSSELVYVGPEAHAVAGSKSVGSERERVWQDVVREVARPPFRLIAKNEAAGFVVVGFDASGPERQASELFDCGLVQRSVIEDGETTEYAYALGARAVDREVIGDDQGFVVRDLRLEPRLDARSTLYLEAQGPDETRVTVNTRYTLVLEVSGEEVRLPRRRSEQPEPPSRFGPEQWEVRFRSSEPGAFSGDRPYRCRSTGVLEARLLSLAEGDAGAQARRGS
jgi:hypothetical protein